MIAINLSSFVFACALWLPQGEDFNKEALRFLARADARGEGLFSQASAEKAFAQREELKSDPRDWEGVAAQVLDPANALTGEGAAIQMLHVRDSFGDERLVRALISRLDYEADLASSNSDPNTSIYTATHSSFGNLVGNICDSGEPEIIGFILNRMLEDNGKFYKLLDSQNYLSVFKGLKKSGSGENLPELKRLVEKLENDGKTKAVELGRAAIIDITRRSEGAKGTDISSGVRSMRGDRSEIAPGTATPEMFTPGKIVSTAVTSLLVGAAVYLALRRKN